MEKLSQIKSKFFKFLSKQPVAFQNPSLSPCRSPARVSIIPKEARRKHKGGSFREPSSPKVTCMGQVQCKKKRKLKKQIKKAPMEKIIHDSVLPCPEKKKILLWISSEGKKQSGKTLVLEEKGLELETLKAAPSLCTMKKFSSGRGSLCDFDFTVKR